MDLESTPQPGLPHLIQAQTRQDPDAAAVVCGTEQLSWRELESVSNRVAQFLVDRGLSVDEPVAVCMGRSLNTVATLYGVLKAGGAYLPMDPAYPEDRLRMMLEDSRARFLIHDEKTPDGISSGEVESIEVDAVLRASTGEHGFVIPSGVGGENLAYIIYTSGSTGRPKGVEIPHRAVCNLIRSMQRILGFSADDVMLGTSSFSFDLSVAEVFLPLATGARLELAPDGATRDGVALAELIESSGATWMQATPTQWQLLLDSGWRGSARLSVMAGGEEVPAPLAEQLRPIVRDVWVGYGPTETTVWSTMRRIEKGETPVLVGGRFDNTHFELVNEAGGPVADGETGELLIGGAGLARGYRFDEQKTAERFVMRHRAETGEPERFYRSGDLFTRRPDGLLAFQGRTDHQVKIRGFRIELGEVEAALAAHPAIARAVVIAAGEGAARSLVAGCRVPDGEAPPVSEIREFLLKSLPEYMLPARFAFYAEFPLTPNRKIDRRAIAEAALASTAAGDGELAEAGTTEAEVQAIVSEVLQIPALGLDADFFEAGGNSLLAGQVIARLREKFGVAPGWRQFFDGPTVRALAAGLQDGFGDAAGFPVPVPSGIGQREYPLSAAQERLWFLEKAYPGNMAYTFQCVLHFSGPLEVEALRHALSGIVRRHGVFRSTFHDRDSGPVQQLHKAGEISLPLVDLRDLPESGREEHARERMHEEIAKPFDLGREFPVRWVLYRLGDERYQLLHHEHHLVHDGWSFRLMVGDLVELYTAEVEGRPPRLPALSCEFGDFALAERDWLNGPEAERQLAYWREKLTAGLPPMELPYDRMRPPQQSLLGGSFRSHLPIEACRAARAFARQEGMTLYTVLLGAFHVMLRRITGNATVFTGCGIANRKSRLSEGVIGMFVNNVVYQNEISDDDRCVDLVRRAFDWTIEAQDHSDVPFDHVVRAVGEEPGLSRNPLFQVMFNAHDAAVPDLRIPGIDLRLEEVMRNGSAKFDLNVIVMPHSRTLANLGSGLDPDSISILWEFSSDIFDESTVRRLAETYHHVVSAMLENISMTVAEVPMLPEAAKHEVVSDWNATAQKFPRDATVYELFEEMAAKRLEQPALLTDDGVISYRDLNQRAEKFAAELTARGAAGTFVAVDVPRSAEFVAAVLGILKAGAAYLPLPAGNPAERNDWIVRNAGAHLLVTRGEEGQGLAITSFPGASPRRAEGFDDAPALRPAYAMYTSGSTGHPKGVVVPHRAIVRLVRGQDYAPFGMDERFLLMAPVSFDASTFELWGPLLNGASCAVYEEPWPEPSALEDFVRRHKVTVMWLTSALFNQIVDVRPDVFQGVRCLLAGGEALSVDHVRRVLERHPHLQLVNGYGPTESTTFACTHRIDAREVATLPRLPIGRPIANTRCYILDVNRHPVPVGVSGELYIGGDGLALGYLNDPEKTRAAFVADPFGEDPAARLYRTGDLCRWRPDGTIDFLGRVDDQVKIRGFRIEPGEVASVLRTHTNLRDAFVTVVDDAGAEKKLIGYAVPRNGAECSDAQLLDFLREQLPGYMIPASIVLLEKLPLTANGKVDRRQLPVPTTITDSTGTSEVDVAATDLELVVAEIFAEVLQSEAVAMDRSFFELGGHSLAAMRVIARIEEEIGATIRLATFFRDPTVRGIARLVEDSLAEAES